MPPLFSIITATFNAEPCLNRLLDSLAEQTDHSFNLILQDGDSHDATVGLAEARRHALPELLVESTPDTGIYNAWNKALDRTPNILGDWVLFLGADDSLAAPDALSQVRRLVENLPPDVLFAFGDCLMVDYASGESRLMPNHPHNTVFEMQKHMAIANPACFYRREVFSGQRFDESFRIAGDFDFLLRNWKHNEQGRYLDMVVTHMGMGGISTNPKLAALDRHEHYKALFKNNKKRYFIQKGKAGFVQLCSALPCGEALLALCRNAKKRVWR